MPDEHEFHDVPPAGLWISPEGEATVTTEHMLTIKEDPGRFGLAPRDVARISIPALHEIARKLIFAGWTRFRLFSDFWSFEVDNARGRISLVEDILVHHRAYPHEEIRISQAKPKREYAGTVAQFYDRSIFRTWELGRKNRWRFT
jgi:hypothetical protein